MSRIARQCKAATRAHRPSTIACRQLHTTSQQRERDTDTTHFGFKDVPKSAKEPLVQSVFSNVSSKYDLMNDAMSLFTHRLWKDSFVSALDPGRRGPIQCLDVAGGTGDVALRILDHAREKYADRETHVSVVDLNPEMLKEGRKRVKKTMYHNTPQISFHVANAQALPEDTFPSGSADLYTIAFGIRNCTNIPDVLASAHRVLKPGGVFACLEFSMPANALLRSAYDSYSFSIIPLLGTILASDRESYQYLVESIRKFPTQREFARMIGEAGFVTGEEREGEGGAWREMFGGIASVHTGVKV